MEILAARLIEWFTLPHNGLGAVFVFAFVSATLLPMGSEPATFAYAALHPDQFWLVVAVATAGNTAGGALDYWLGRGARGALRAERGTRWLRWLERLGPAALVFAWLPVVGDPLCVLAGWLRLSFWRCLAWIALGKGLRYIIVTALLLQVPDAWWAGLFGALPLQSGASS
jgi:membrane protein YqaA with SNARE-associated domain